MRGIGENTMRIRRQVIAGVIAAAVVSLAGCGDNERRPTPPTAPTPPPMTASAYILPGAVSLNDHAFGDEPIVIYSGERLRWVNADTRTHAILADAPGATDFRTTDELVSGGERAFTMTRLGTTAIHCAIHPNMTARSSCASASAMYPMRGGRR